MFGNFPEFIGQIRDGALRLLAFGDAQPSPLFSDTPLIRSTLPDLSVTSWIGLAGPAGLPRTVITAWNTALNQIVTSTEFRRRLEENGMELLVGDEGAFRATITADRQRWAEVIRAAGMTFSTASFATASCGCVFSRSSFQPPEPPLRSR